MSFCFGAPEGTRTHTLKAREPKGDVTSVKDLGALDYPNITSQKVQYRSKVNCTSAIYAGPDVIPTSFVMVYCPFLKEALVKVMLVSM